MSGIKQCSKADCAQINPQPIENFAKNRTMKDGLAYECKSCMKAYRKIHRKTNRHKQSRKVWSLANPESIKTSKKKDRETHAEHYQKYMRNYHVLDKARKPIIYGLRTYKGSAKQRGLVFELTDAQFVEFVSSTCHYCGLPPLSGRINGIDRIDNKLGYLLTNCVSCCTQCNIMKLDYTYDEFIEHICRIANRLYHKTHLYLSDERTG